MCMIYSLSYGICAHNRALTPEQSGISWCWRSLLYSTIQQYVISISCQISQSRISKWFRLLFLWKLNVYTSIHMCTVPSLSTSYRLNNLSTSVNSILEPTPISTYQSLFASWENIIHGDHVWKKRLCIKKRSMKDAMEDRTALSTVFLNSPLAAMHATFAWSSINCEIVNPTLGNEKSDKARNNWWTRITATTLLMRMKQCSRTYR